MHFKTLKAQESKHFRLGQRVKNWSFIKNRNVSSMVFVISHFITGLHNQDTSLPDLICNSRLVKELDNVSLFYVPTKI